MTRWRCAAAALILALPAGVTAAPVEYGCDTPGGHFSEISLDQAGPAYRVRGTITPVISRGHSRFVATATVIIQSADRNRSVAVQIMRSEASRYTVKAIRVTDGRRAAATLPQIGTGDSVPFELGSTAAGSFARMSGERIDLGPAIGEAAHLSVTCSTGYFRFSGLDWSPD